MPTSFVPYFLKNIDFKLSNLQPYKKMFNIPIFINFYKKQRY